MVHYGYEKVRHQNLRVKVRDIDSLKVHSHFSQFISICENFTLDSVIFICMEKNNPKFSTS